MKWRTYKIGNLKVAVGEKRSIHSCNPREPRLDAANIIGVYLVVYWRGIEKWSQVVGLEQ